MAKQQVALKTQDLPAEMLEELDKHSGEGVSTRSEDQLIPLIQLLQDMSPQVKKREPKYLDGAEPGDIILTSLNRIYKGAEGFLFQPVAFVVDWGEWVPRDKGGGFVARHPALPANAVATPDPKTRRPRYSSPDGNDLIETRNHFGFILDPELGPMQALLPLTSTGHQVSRTWMTMMGTKRLPSGRVAPSYSRGWRITSTVRKNPGNPDSFTYAVADEGWLDKEQIRLGILFAQDVAAGRKTAAEPVAEVDDEVPF